MAPNREIVIKDVKSVKTYRRKRFTCAFKLDVIKRGDAGENMSSIARSLNLSRSTVATIYCKRDDVRQHVALTGNTQSMVMSKRRFLIMDKMESMLREWMEEQSRESLFVSNAMIQEKARSIFTDLKEAGPSAAADLSFCASNGWLRRFQNRCSMLLTNNQTSVDDWQGAIDFNEEVDHLSDMDCDDFEGESDESKTVITCAAIKSSVITRDEDDDGAAVAAPSTSSILPRKTPKRGIKEYFGMKECVVLVDPHVTSSLTKNWNFKSEILFPDTLNGIIAEGGYDSRQVWSVNETGLYWKKILFRTYLDMDNVETVSGLNYAKDRLSLLLGGNANGDCKLKPMLIYHTETPIALQSRAKSMFPVIWKSNKQASVTADLFTDWFILNFIPVVKQYCLENNLPFKALLVLDNSSSHPQSLGDLCSNVKIVYFPPKVSNLLQPMNQTVTEMFKRYYLERIMTQAMIATEGDEGVTLKEFWEGYNMWHCIKNIGHAWSKIKEHTMNGAWSRLCPQFVDYFDGTEEKLEDVTQVIVELGRQLNLEVDNADVNKLMMSHDDCMSEEDLRRIREHLLNEESADCKVPPSQGLTLKHLRQAFKMQEDLISIFEDNDINCERSLQIRRDIEKATLCYRDIYMQKKKLSNSFT